MKVQHIFILCMVVSPNIYIQTSAYSAEDALFKHLLDNCSRSTRPVHRQDTTMNVTFNIWLMQILEVDERNQKMTMKVNYDVLFRLIIFQIGLHTKDSLMICLNYRPISLLSGFSKIYDKLIYTKIFDYPIKKDIIGQTIRIQI